MLQYYKIADLLVAMDTYGRTQHQAEAYLSEADKEPDIIITSYRELMHQLHPTLSDDDCEYMGTGGSFYKELLKFDGFMLHSSAVVMDGKAYLFSANPGTGKSTHSELWLKVFGDRAYILNDDKPALRLIDGVWHACGTPWSGKNDISSNTCVPVGGICMLFRGETNQITPYTGKDAIFDLFVQTNRPKAMENRIILLDLLDKLFRQVPVWKLHCNMDPEAAVVSYEAMSGKKWR